MPRKANGVRRGPKTWAKGSQIEFLRSRFTSWVSCTNSNLRGNLYTNVTWLFIKKYGWQLEDNDDADPDEGDIGEIREELANTGELNEQEAYQKIFKRTRSVCVNILSFFICSSLPSYSASLPTFGITVRRLAAGNPNSATHSVLSLFLSNAMRRRGSSKSATSTPNSTSKRTSNLPSMPNSND